MVINEKKIRQKLNLKANKIKLIAMDVDGVLTDGNIILGVKEEIKFFNVQDGMGINLAKQAGLIVAFITGRQSRSVSRRAEELGIEEVHQKSKDKEKTLMYLISKYGIEKNEVAYIGDDIMELIPFRKTGFKIAVSNAAKEVKEMADYITVNTGGNGAVRETIELILKSQKKWDKLIKQYRGSQ
mgnify:FL=1|jgi:3-deoxy-D-manno-octulosonate 8-phosphate phosphatase (KDO 8-P phosphatase)|tara:strand:- start:133 stop:684 length:552 start_codon:yes stop_codon:yes gene_type:complete